MENTLSDRVEAWNFSSKILELFRAAYDHRAVQGQINSNTPD